MGAPELHALRRRARSSSGGATSSRSSAAGRHDFTCEDIELTFRVHRTLRERGRDYRIACLPDCIGVTEGPDSVKNLVSQRERWQRVILETCWANRRMWFNPRYGTVGLLGVPYYLVSEILAPGVRDRGGRAPSSLGGVAGLIDWREFALLVLLITFINSALTTGRAPDARPRGARIPGLGHRSAARR